ncbi:hypothetical protein KGO95_03855 [Patescibacteria group bacterium]|nr:hypothetical protein [Patescibacteria group bacterium]
MTYILLIYAFGIIAVSRLVALYANLISLERASGIADGAFAVALPLFFVHLLFYRDGSSEKHLIMKDSYGLLRKVKVLEETDKTYLISCDDLTSRPKRIYKDDPEIIEVISASDPE